MSATEQRVALVTNVLAHYRVACFQQLNERLDQRLTIYLLAGDMQHRRYVLAEHGGELPVVTLPGWHWHQPPFDDRHINDVRPVLRDPSQTLILSAWDEPTYLLLWTWALLRRRKVIFWIESTAVDMPRGRAKEALKRLLLKKSAACMVPGQRAAAYCQQLGMSPQRIFTAPNAADRAFFRARADRLLPQRDALRQSAGLESFTVLFVGRLVEYYKGIETLISASSKLEQRGIPATLALAGEGPDEARYRQLAAEHSLGDVRFLGNLPHEELCRTYATADVLVLPSVSETWGFVLNEAMEFGCPLIVSDRVGAGPDLVHPQDNGFVFPAGDADRLANALETLARDPRLRRRMGDASRRIVTEFSPSNWAAGALEAIGAAGG
ncbi:MAG: glycosyltransferase [Acidobacteriota bacterium]